MQYARKVTFNREIVLAAIYGALLPKARRFSKGETVIGVALMPCNDGHRGGSVVTVRCDKEDNDKDIAGFTYNGDFILANVPEDAITVEEIGDTNEVIVGNIGSVYRGDDEAEAKRTFNTYRDQSIAQHGRAAGETVTWLRNDEIHEEHTGTVDQTTE